MAPIILLRISRTLILQSVVRVLSFRKRPSETHSGPGLETPTDAVTFVRLQHQVRSRPDQRASRRGLFFCYKYFSCCLAQRILCEVSFVSFSSLLPPYQLLSLSPNKASADNAGSKGLQPYTTPKHTRTAWSCSCSKGGRISLRIKQTKYAAAATCTRYVVNPWTCRCTCTQACGTNCWVRW